MSSPWNPTGLGGEETVMLESQGHRGVMEQSVGAAATRSPVSGMLYICLCVSFPTGQKPWVVGRGRFICPLVG